MNLCILSKRFVFYFHTFQATNYKMFGESFHWLIMGRSLNKSLELIDDTSFGLSTDFAIGVSEKNNYIFYDVHNPCKIRGGSQNITLSGSWNLSSGLNFLVKYKKTDRWNLQGMDFKISGLVRTIFIVNAIVNIHNYFYKDIL